MTAFSPITPMKAVELVEAAGIEDARRIIADFTAGGLVKSYALVVETIDARGISACVRGAAIPAGLWQRVILDGIADDAWPSGTVRLAGSDMIGGEPAAVVTGITFSPKHIDWLIAHHLGTPQSRRRKRGESMPAVAVAAPDAQADAPAPSERKKPCADAIPTGAALVTVKQAMAALSVSRGTIDNLVNRGTLVRTHIGRAARIEVAGILALVGRGHN